MGDAVKPNVSSEDFEIVCDLIEILMANVVPDWTPSLEAKQRMLDFKAMREARHAR